VYFFSFSANGLYPDHLGEAFVKVYADMKNDRTSFKKGTPENAMLKLALNGAYGKSLSKHSVLFFDIYIIDENLLCDFSDNQTTKILMQL
jgi:hypothetical protein